MISNVSSAIASNQLELIKDAVTLFVLLFLTAT